jgi:GNAT superfamily N-acetyltransferase
LVDHTGSMDDNPVQIEVTQNVEPENRQLLARRLQEFNAPYLGSHPFGNLDVYVRDSDGQVVGGLVGEFAFGWLVIRVLWLEERFRRRGIGTRILASAENTAIEKGCHAAILDTMSFQAPAFYEKHGYVRVGLVDGYPGGAQQIFMRKELAPSRA